MAERLLKKDARALWWAIDWAASVLREWKREGFKDADDQSKYDAELKKLLHAKYALRKVRAAAKAPQPGCKALEEPAQVEPEHQARVDQMAADAEARRERERGILLEAANHLEGDGHFMPAEDADWAAGWIRRQIGAGTTP